MIASLSLARARRRRSRRTYRPARPRAWRRSARRRGRAQGSPRRPPACRRRAPRAERRGRRRARRRARRPARRRRSGADRRSGAGDWTGSREKKASDVTRVGGQAAEPVGEIGHRRSVSSSEGRRAEGIAPPIRELINPPTRRENTEPSPLSGELHAASAVRPAVRRYPAARRRPAGRRTRPRAAAARARDATLTKPPGSLGRLEEIAEWVAAWQGQERPAVTRPLVAVFAANHGIAARGVSAYPQAVTRQMVANFAAGGAAINQICKRLRARPEGVRAGARPADARHRRGGRLRREGLRGDDRLRHGGGRRRRRPSLPRRDGDRQHDRRGGDLSTRSMAARRPTGSGAAPASTTPACARKADAVAAAVARIGGGARPA